MWIISFIIGCLVICTSARSYEEAMSGDVSLLYTSDNYTYNDVYLEVLERNYIVFKVKACSDAHVALIETYEYQGDHTGVLLEVVLGGWTNTLSVVRYGAQGETLVETYTYDLLHCGEFRSFWIHWSTDIKVGRGAQLYNELLMTAPRHSGQHFEINYVAFSTGFGHTGVWEVQQGMAYHLMLNTPDVTPQAFQYMTRSVERSPGFFTFRAVTCKDLHIAMGPENHNWKYRVNLCAWDNTKQCIVYGGQANCVNRTSVCQCGAYKSYWISWRNNVIRAGEGNRIYENQLVEFTPPEWYSVSFLSFSTGFGAKGLWVFDEDLENSWDLTGTRYTEYDYFENWVMISKNHHVPFQLQACSDAWICFSSSPGICEEGSYTLFIAKNNANSGISKGVGADEIEAAHTPELLNCNMSLPFWVSWHDRKIEFGEGNHEGWGKIIEYVIPEGESFDVSSIGLGTSGVKTVWSVHKNHGDQFYAITPPEFRYQNLWMTVYQDFVVYVKIRGSKSAVIVLSEIVGYPYEYSMEVVIGYQDTKCVIREKSGDEYTIVKEEETGVLLTEEGFKTFWVSWKEGLIKLGQGYRSDRRLLVASTIYIPHVINGVGVSGESTALQWQFEAEQGNYFTMRCDSHGPPYYNWLHLITEENGYWLYFQVSGSAACLTLSTVYGETKDAYAIHIGEEQNTKVTLYYKDEEVTAIVSPNVMDELELKDFWISWEGGNIQFGKSRFKGKDTLLSYQGGDKFKAINSIALSGLDQSVAVYRFAERQGVKEFSYQTSIHEDSQQIWMALVRTNSMVFGVQACNDAHLWFGSIMYSYHWYDNYLIVLQDMEGYSYISAPWYSDKGWESKKEVEIHRPGLLSCDEERMFWVSWYERELIIGTGTKPGDNILMSFHDFDPIPVRAMSVHTQNVIGKFRFPTDYREFMDKTPQPSDALSAGQIVGVVFGFLILTALFVGVIFVILKPPAQLRAYLSPPPTAGSSNRQIAEQQLREQRSHQGFNNPLHQAGADGEGGV